MKTTMQEKRKGTYGNAGKKLFIVLFSLGLAFGASAQRGGGHAFVGGGYHGAYYAPRAYYAPAYVGVGYGWGWGLGLGWAYPGWYGPWYAPYPPYYYGRGPMPPALNEQIEGIKSDYKAQIKDVKHDKALSHSDKTQKINQLEQQRDAAITQARHDFYSRQMRNSNGEPQRYNNNGQPQNNAQPQNNSNNVQPGPGSSSSNDPQHPEYSDKNAASANQP